MQVELVARDPGTFSCKGGDCPGVFRTDRGTFLIQGYRVNRGEVSGLGGVAEDEDLVEIPASLLSEMS
jgi:hypothetical protein